MKIDKNHLKILRVSNLRELWPLQGLQTHLLGSVEFSKGGLLSDSLTIFDLSTFDRIGLKGVESQSWLRTLEIDLPQTHNQLLCSPEGRLVVRYSPSEFMLSDISNVGSYWVEEIRTKTKIQKPVNCYQVPRSDGQAAFGLVGSKVLDCLSHLTPADLRFKSFQVGSVLQTLCAGISAQILFLKKVEVKNYVIVLCDVSYAHYFWSCLSDAGSDYSMQVSGQDQWVTSFQST